MNELVEIFLKLTLSMKTVKVHLIIWTTLGPEIARAIEEFGQSQDLLDVCSDNHADCYHYHQMKSVQKTFITQVKRFCQPMELMGNPFSF